MTVKEFHEAVDGIIDRTEIRQQSCCSTCTLATCCNEPVYVGKDEVQWMLDSLTLDQTEYVMEQTIEWSKKAQATGMLKERQPSAYKWLPHKIPCPFLTEDRKCIAYDRRPMSCRMWFARSNPENCDMPGRLHQQHAHFPPEHGPNSTPIMAYFDERVRDGSLHMDHLGAVLVELFFGIDLGSAAKTTAENMHRMKDEEWGPT